MGVCGLKFSVYFGCLWGQFSIPSLHIENLLGVFTHLVEIKKNGVLFVYHETLINTKQAYVRFVRFVSTPQPSKHTECGRLSRHTTWAESPLTVAATVLNILTWRVRDQPGSRIGCVITKTANSLFHNVTKMVKFQKFIIPIINFCTKNPFEFKHKLGIRIIYFFSKKLVLKI